MAANKLIDLAVVTTDFGKQLVSTNDATAARALLEVAGGVTVTSVNGEIGAVVLDYTDVGAASAAQGAKADTALQPGDVSDAVSSVNGKAGAVVLTYSDVGAASAAQGAKADTAVQPGDVSYPVTSVQGKTGVVNLMPSDIGAATSAQGAKADTAVQPGDVSYPVTSVNGKTGGVTLAAADVGAATAAQGALASTAVQRGLGNTWTAGVMPVLADIDNPVNTGWAQATPTTTGGTKPQNSGIVHTISNLGDSATASGSAWLYQYFYSALGGQGVYVRNRINGAAWTAWTLVSSSGGFVPAVGGTMTGALTVNYGVTPGTVPLLVTNTNAATSGVVSVTNDINVGFQMGVVGSAQTGGFSPVNSGFIRASNSMPNFNFESTGRFAFTGSSGTVNRLSINAASIQADVPMVLNSPLRLAQYTVATLPSAATYNGYIVHCTNLASGAEPVQSNGTNWLKLSDRSIAS